MSLLTEASLVILPNSVEEGKLLSIIPADGSGDMTAVRATTATLVNSEGVIEDCPYNLFTYSNVFDNANWIKSNSIATPTIIESPILGQNAYLYSITNLSNFINQSKSVMQSPTNLSVFVKKNIGSFVQLNLGSNFAVFNLDTQVFSNITNCVPSFQSFPNGWFKLSIFANVTTNQAAFFNIPNTGSIIDSFYISCAQLVTGTEPKEYFPTTDRLNVPRLDYTSGSCPSILVEPQRTNLFLNSVFNGTGSLPTSWTFGASGGTSFPTTSIKSTVVQAYTFVTSASRQFLYQLLNYVSGTTYTCSVYVESVTGNIAVANILYFNGTGTQSFYKDGVLITNLTNIVAGSRYTAVFSSTATLSQQVRVGNGCGGNSTGSVTLSMPQLEAGANATSYIPTVASAVTRNADVITKSNIFTENLITSSGGTLFLRLSKNDLLVRQAAQGIFLNQLKNNTGYGLHIVNLESPPSSGRLGVRKIDVNGNIAIYNTTESELKLLLKWNGSSLDIFQNGIKVVSNSSFLVTNMQFLSFQALDVVKNINNCILFPKALTDQECIDLTTL